MHNGRSDHRAIDATRLNQKVDSVKGPAGERGSISRGARSWKSVTARHIRQRSCIDRESTKYTDLHA